MNEEANFRALDIRDLSVRRSDFTVLEGVTLTLRPGSCLVLRGPNGAGKSTLLRCIAGLLPSDHGTIGISGTAVETNLNGHISFLGHLNGVKSAMTVIENSYFWADLYKKSKQAADLAIANLRLSELRNKLASTLSAGQKRRLAIARLCIAKKAIWLLDEPTAGIDASNISVVEQIIGSHCRNGGAAIIATHDVLSLCECETYLLSSGHL